MLTRITEDDGIEEVKTKLGEVIDYILYEQNKVSASYDSFVESIEHLVQEFKDSTRNSQNDFITNSKDLIKNLSLELYNFKTEQNESWSDYKLQTDQHIKENLLIINQSIKNIEETSNKTNSKNNDIINIVKEFYKNLEEI